METKQKIILHIGPHKTGTTALQAVLKANSAELTNVGWKYIEEFKCGLSAHALADHISTGRLERANEAIAELRCETYNLVLSSENFSRFDKSQISFFLGKLYGIDVKVVYFVRNPVERLMSAWRELVKHGYTYSLPEYFLSRLSKFDSDGELNDLIRISYWEAVVPNENLFIFNYDSCLDVSESFCNQFFAGANINYYGNLRVNESNNESVTECIRATKGLYRSLLAENDLSKPEWNEFFSIEKELNETAVNSGYVRHINISLDEGIFNVLEENIKKRFPHLCLENGDFFKKRSVDLSYIDSSAWAYIPYLCVRMEHLRKSIQKKYPVTQLDLRLMRL